MWVPTNLRGSFFLNLSDIDSIEAPQFIKKDDEVSTSSEE